jgi:geranylgeranyl transferase type-2 subunit alpha
VKLIRALQDDAIRRRAARAYDATSMAVTARLLEINPEVFTAWNFRRETIATLETRAAAAAAATTPPPSDSADSADPEASDPPYVPSLEDELALTEKTLRKNPKSYPSWHHRKWTVSRAAARASDDAFRLGLGDAAPGDSSGARIETRHRAPGPGRPQLPRVGVPALRERPARHHRGGGARVRHARKIRANFSNYSAWHLRTAALPLARGVPREAPGEERALPSEVLDEEYELARQAFFTEPEDQSAWMYHRWLVARTARDAAGAGDGGEAAREAFAREISACRELAEMEPESKWPVATLARLCAEVGTEEAERERVESLRRLEGLDPMRRGYYCDCCESLR